MAAKRTFIIILLVVGALGAGLVAYLLNVKTVEVYDGVTATVIFGSLSEAETERLLVLSEQTDDDEKALTLVTFAYTHHDGGLKDDLLLSWSSILLERDEFANACRVLDELVLLHAAGGLDAPERLGETLLARFDGDLVSEEGFRYATAVRLRGYCGEVSPSSLASYDALLDRELDRPYDLEWVLEFEREMAYRDPKTAQRDLGAVEMEAERRAPAELAALLAARLELGPPPLQDAPLVSEVKLAEYLHFTDRISYEILETELESLEEEEGRRLEGEPLVGVREPEEEEEADPFADLSEAERALIEEALAAARTREGPKWKATTRIRCALAGLTLREVLERQGLDPYTGRPTLAEPVPTPPESGD